MSPSPEEVRRLHAEARAEKRRRLEQMSPIERMEEAYRLFRLVQDEEDATS